MPIFDPSVALLGNSSLAALDAKNRAAMMTPQLLAEPLAAIANMRFRDAMLNKQFNHDRQSQNLAAVQRLGEQLGEMWMRSRDMQQQQSLAQAQQLLRQRELEQQRELTLKELGMRYGADNTQRQLENMLAQGDMDISAGRLDTPAAKLSQSYGERGLRGNPKNVSETAADGEAAAILDQLHVLKNNPQKLQQAIDSNWPAVQKLLPKLGDSTIAGQLQYFFASKINPQTAAVPQATGPGMLDDLFRWFRENGVGQVTPRPAMIQPSPSWWDWTGLPQQAYSDPGVIYLTPQQKPDPERGPR